MNNFRAVRHSFQPPLGVCSCTMITLADSKPSLAHKFGQLVYATGAEPVGYLSLISRSSRTVLKNAQRTLKRCV